MSEVARKVVGLPAAAAAELEALERDDGSLDLAEIVEAARPAGTALHAHFTWDNRQAADERRLDQARGLVARYRVRFTREIAEGEDRELLVRGYVAASRAGIPERPAGTYVNTGSLPSANRSILLQQMRREIRAMRTRYESLPEFWDAVNGLAEEGNGAAASGA